MQDGRQSDRYEADDTGSTSMKWSALLETMAKSAGDLHAMDNLAGLLEDFSFKNVMGEKLTEEKLMRTVAARLEDKGGRSTDDESL